MIRSYSGSPVVMQWPTMSTHSVLAPNRMRSCAQAQNHHDAVAIGKPIFTPSPRASLLPSRSRETHSQSLVIVTNSPQPPRRPD